MRRILAALAALLLLGAPARAFNPTQGSPRVVPAKTLPFRADKPLAQRVLVMFDAYDDALNQANVKAEAAIIAKELGPTFDAWRIDGDAQVDFCRSDFFEGYADSISGSSSTQRPCALWQTLGSYYPTVVCVGFSADTSTGKVARKRYFSADSTTAKVIHVGGWSGGSNWTTGSVATADTGGIGAYFDQRKAAVSAYANTNSDTLWMGLGGYGVRSGFLPAGVSSVVRLFRPIALSTYFGWGPDSSWANYGILPAVNDTVAKPGEVMPVAWRVYWTTSGRSVDFLKVAGTADYDGSIGHILTALVSRTTLLKPTKMAMEFDDVFDNNPTTATRPGNSAWDSVFVEFRTTWGVPVTISTNPRHAAEYYAGSTPTREGTWSGAGWTWIRRGIPWVHHAHDSTSSDISSNLVGRFGGYQSQNGSGLIPWTSTGGDATDSLFMTGFNRYFYTHRYASQQPTSDKYTMLYRLQWSDSLRRATCPECFTPPYLSFSNNEMLPTDWRLRTASVASANAAGYWSRWKSYQGSGACTIDSTLWAMHMGLGIPSGGTLYVRTTTPNNGTGAAFNYKGHYATGYALAGDDAPKNWTVSGDNDSVVAKTPYSWPDERETKWINSRLVAVRNLATTAYDGGARSVWTANVSRIIPALMGSRTGNLTSAGFSTWSDSWSADPGGVINGAATDQKNSGTGHARIVYLHPSAGQGAGGWSFATGPKTSYSIQVARLGLLAGFRTLNAVAGHNINQWVYPWQVYDR